MKVIARPEPEIENAYRRFLDDDFATMEMMEVRRVLFDRLVAGEIDIEAVEKKWPDTEKPERSDQFYVGALSLLKGTGRLTTEEDILSLLLVMEMYEKGHPDWGKTGYFISAMVNLAMEAKKESDRRIVLPLGELGKYLEGLCYWLQAGTVICDSDAGSYFAGSQLGGKAFLKGRSSYGTCRRKHAGLTRMKSAGDFLNILANGGLTIVDEETGENAGEEMTDGEVYAGRFGGGSNCIRGGKFFLSTKVE